MRRRMQGARTTAGASHRPFTVALVGADGAGKTTVARRLAREAPLPIKYLYMGVSREASNRMLPTTWLLWRLKRLAGRRERGGPPDPEKRRDGRAGKGTPSLRKRLLSQAKEAAHVLNLLAEEWFRQLLTASYKLRGYTVLFDRHFYLDYYAHDVEPQGEQRSVWRRAHGFVLRRLLPKPDLVVLLDAPAEVLFARKPEGTVELLERRRQEYWQLQEHVERFVVVDATKPQDEVAAAVVEAIVAAGGSHPLHAAQPGQLEVDGP